MAAASAGGRPRQRTNRAASPGGRQSSRSCSATAPATRRTPPTSPPSRNIDRVIAVAGPACLGAVLASANSVTIPAGVLMITPFRHLARRSPSFKDKGPVHRTPPSDDYQGCVLARTLKARHRQGGGGLPEQRLRQGPGRILPSEFAANGGTTPVIRATRRAQGLPPDIGHARPRWR